MCRNERTPTPVIDFPAGDPPTELVIRDIVVGEGKEAKAGDKVLVHYAGVDFATGEEFDSSWRRGRAHQLPAGGPDPGLAGRHPRDARGRPAGAGHPAATGLWRVRRPPPGRMHADLRDRPPPGGLGRRACGSAAPGPQGRSHEVRHSQDTRPRRAPHCRRSRRRTSARRLADGGAQRDDDQGDVPRLRRHRFGARRPRAQRDPVLGYLRSCASTAARPSANRPTPRWWICSRARGPHRHDPSRGAGAALRRRDQLRRRPRLRPRPARRRPDPPEPRPPRWQRCSGESAAPGASAAYAGKPPTARTGIGV